MENSQAFALKMGKTHPTKVFRDYMVLVGTLSDEPTFSIDATGLSTRGMDPSRVSMIDFVMPTPFFDEVIVKAPMKFCIKISELLKLLKRATKEETVELSLDSTINKFIFKILKEKKERRFTLPSAEPSEEAIPLPKLTYSAIATVNTAGLSQAVEDAQIVSDHVKMEAEGEKITLQALGETSGATITLDRQQDKVLLDIHVKELTKAVYSLTFLSEIFKAAKETSEMATLEYAKDFPVKITFQQPDQIEMVFFLAPRIETEAS